MRQSVVGILLAAALLGEPARAATPVPLAPTTPWNIDYSDDSCALRRTFGAGVNEVVLEIRQFTPGDALRLIAASRSSKLHQRAPKIRWNPADKSEEIENANFLDFDNGLKGVGWAYSFLPDLKRKPGNPPAIRSDAEHLAAETHATMLEIGGMFSPPIILATGSMHKPMEAMRTCLDELVTHWGIDAKAQRTLSRNAWPVEYEKWVPKIQAEYPAQLIGAKNGLVRVRMIVGIDGKPTACHVQMKSQDPQFEQTACAQMMKYARFSPALDANGKPLASYWATTIFYNSY